jgi:hypothetical protein
MPRRAWGIVLCGCFAACGAAVPETAGFSVAGLALGDAPAAAERALGRPERRETSLGLVFWDYDRRGLTLMWDDDEAVLRAVVLKKAGAGAIEGVAVGDSVAVMRERWGEPARVRQDGRFLDFMRPSWVQTAELQGGRVVEITLMAR